MSILKAKIDDLFFNQVRTLTNQWDVYFLPHLKGVGNILGDHQVDTAIAGKKPVARVTQRVVKKPPFSVIYINIDGKEVGEQFYASRHRVAIALLAWIDAGQVGNPTL